MATIPRFIADAEIAYRAILGAKGAPHGEYKIKYEGWEGWELRTMGGPPVYIVSAPGVRAEYNRLVAQGAAIAGGSRSGGAGGAGQALAATQTQPQLTGGGAGFQIGGVQNTLVSTERADEYQGINTLIAPEKLPSTMSPDAVNWDDIKKQGSRCKRDGVAKLKMDRDSITISASPPHADYRGLSLCVVPSSGNNPDQMLIAIADADIGSLRAAQQTSLHDVTQYVRWGRPVTPVKGPKIALTDATGGQLDIAIDYTNVFNASTQVGVRENSVVALVVRYSSVGYPQDIDGKDEMSSTVLEDRTAYTGTSYTGSVAGLALQRWYVTAWAVTREGYSEPSFASKTLA